MITRRTVLKGLAIAPVVGMLPAIQGLAQEADGDPIDHALEQLGKDGWDIVEVSKSGLLSNSHVGVICTYLIYTDASDLVHRLESAKVRVEQQASKYEDRYRDISYSKKAVLCVEEKMLYYETTIKCYNSASCRSIETLTSYQHDE